MNERINELYKQAFLNERLAHDPRYKFDHISELLMKDFQKVYHLFAVSIINECAWVAQTAVNHNDEPSSVIKKYFGVTDGQ